MAKIYGNTTTTPINPDAFSGGGSGQDIVIDQKYSPTSKNAQSGKAVAEAVNGRIPKPNGDWLDPLPRVLIIKSGGINLDENNQIPDSQFSTVNLDYHGFEFVPGNIPVRGNNGNLQTETPTSTYDCTNKEYVDNVMGEAKEALDHIIDIQDTLIGEGNKLGYATEQYVDDAVANSGGNDWELLADITIDSPCGKVQIVEDMNGNPFNLKKAYLVVDYYKNGDINTNLRGAMTNDLKHNPWLSNLFSFEAIKYNTTHASRSVLIERICGINKIIGIYSPPNDSSMVTCTRVVGDDKNYSSDDAVALGFLENIPTTEEMRGLSIGSYQETIGVGTRIKLYGVRV